MHSSRDGEGSRDVMGHVLLASLKRILSSCMVRV